MRNRSTVTLFALALLTLSNGCTRLIEREVLKLANRDLQLANDVQLIAGDLALFRRCLKQRGGRCVGSAATSLPHSGNAVAGRPTRPTMGEASRTLAEAVAALPTGHPARTAYKAMGHSVTRQSAALHDHLRGHPYKADTPGVSIQSLPSESTASDGEGQATESVVTMDLKLHKLDDFARLFAISLGGRGFERLQALCASLEKQLASAPESERESTEHECRRVLFVRQYLAAYFRHGHIVEATLDTRGLIEEVDQATARLKSKIRGPDDNTDSEGRELEKALDKLEAAARARLERESDKLNQDIDSRITAHTQKIDTSLSQVFRIDSTGFISRDTTYGAKFPSFELTFDPTAAKPLSLRDRQTGQTLVRGSSLGRLGVMNAKSGARISSELVRVFLEAIFDAHEGLPALAPQNGPAATGLGLGSLSLPLFQPPMGRVSSADWNAMLSINARVEANVKTVLSRIVAGIGPISLNNPPLEDLIVELISTAVRKASEKATWCWYACNLDVDLRKAKADLQSSLREKEKALGAEARKELAVPAKALEVKAKQAGRKLEAYNHRLAQKVRLRLQLGL